MRCGGRAKIIAVPQVKLCLGMVLLKWLKIFCLILKKKNIVFQILTANEKNLYQNNLKHKEIYYLLHIKIKHKYKNYFFPYSYIK